MKVRKVDLFTPTEIRLWYRLWSNGCLDLYPTECAEDSIGEVPSWWENDPEDLSTILGVDEFSNEGSIDIDGLTFHYPWMLWALRNGVAPGQAFQVAFGKPEYHRTSYEYDEWDAEWCGVLHQVEACRAISTANKWDKYLEKLRRLRLLAVREYKDLELSVMKNTGAMVIRKHHYTPDKGRICQGVGMSLVTVHGRFASISGRYVRSEWGCGRSDSGDSQQAMEILIEEACRNNPYLCPEVIQSMKVRHT